MQFFSSPTSLYALHNSDLYFVPFTQPKSLDIYFSCRKLDTSHDEKTYSRYSKIDPLSTSALGGTSIKVNGAILTCNANVSSPRVLNIALDRLENIEYRPLWIRPTILANIQAARSLVNEIATAFEDLQLFEKKLNSVLNEIQRATPSVHTEKAQEIINKLLLTLTQNTLPAELTRENIETYKIKIREAIQEFDAQVTLIEHAIVSQQTAEKAKANEIGTSTLNTKSDTESSLKNKEESLTNTSESSSEVTIGPTTTNC